MAPVTTVVVGGFKAFPGDAPTAAHLYFTLPYDDGGSPILGYHVWAMAQVSPYLNPLSRPLSRPPI